MAGRGGREKRTRTEGFSSQGGAPAARLSDITAFISIVSVTYRRGLRMTGLDPRSRGKVGSLPGELVSGQDGCPRVQGGEGCPWQVAWPVLP